MKTERILAIIAAIALLLKFLHFPGSGVLLVLSLSTLALIYFPGAFYFFSDQEIKRQNISLSGLGGFFLSMIPVGILFKLQYWPGSTPLLLAGAIAAPVLLVIVLEMRKKAPDELKVYYRNMVLRTSIFASLAIILLLLPSSALIKTQYWDDPELGRLKALHYTNPENEQYKQQHDDYIRKKDSLIYAPAIP